tara:strand:+ start:81 stop:365 length:285 start_codon:yes stop_codon:yes gene_type:complete
MASPRTRKIRRLRAMRRAQAAVEVPVAAPEPTPAPEPAPEPVVLDMTPEEDVIVVSSTDYSKMTKAELTEALDARGVEYSRYASKAELVKLAEG